MPSNRLAKLGFRFLRWICPPHLLEEIEGDLLQKFERDVKTFGEKKARRRLVWNTIRFLRPGILLRNKFSVDLNKLPMFQNYFKTTYRHISKSKINFAFKFGGLTLALFSFLVIAIYVSYQLSFDRFHEDHENIYRVNSIRDEGGNKVRYASVPIAIGPALKTEFPEIVAFTRLNPPSTILAQNKNKLIRISDCTDADSSIFDVFTFKFISGTKRALHHPGSVVLTQSIAKQLFSDEDPLNKMIIFPDHPGKPSLQVTAVIEDLPTNSHLYFNAITNFGREINQNSWKISWDESLYLYVRLLPSSNPSDLGIRADPLLRRNLTPRGDGSEKHFSIFLQPISEVYLGEALKWEFHRKGNAIYVYTYSSLAVFLLIIASINFLNLSIADFNFRNKEIGVRKVLGARKKQIAFQVTFESVLYCILSLTFSIGLLYLLFPQLLERLDPNLEFGMLLKPDVAISVAVTLCLLISLSTAYPAFHLSMNNPINDLKRKHGFGGRFTVNKALLLAQFSISVFCLYSTWAVESQLQYIQTKDIGFNRNNLVEVFMPDGYPDQKAPVLKNEINKIVGVEASSFSYYHMTGIPYFNSWYKVEIGNEMKPVLLNELFVDQDFLQTMNVKLLRGRNFQSKNEFKTAYIVNELAVKEFGWTDPIGKRISVGGEKEEVWAEGTVIGVVKDFNTLSLRNKIEPVVMRLQYDSWPGFCLNIRYIGSEKEILSSIKTVYEKVLPGSLINYNSVKERYDNQYQNEKKAHTAMQAGTWIIVLISCIGIFSMSVFLSIRRVKEFGIRKVLGATVQQIATLHVGYFLRIVLLANFIALPIAYSLMREWLRSFAYRVELSGLVFLIVASISILLVIVSAGYSALNAGRMNPVDVIKME